jgi:hypothetical protein
MSAVTSFKVAFLSRCAEEGLTLEQIHERVKTAVARAEAKYGQTGKTASVARVGKLGLLATLMAGAYGGVSKGVEKFWPHLASGFGTWAATGGDLPSTAAGALLGPSVQDKGLSWPALGGGLALLAGGGLAAGKFLANAQSDPLAEDEIKSQELVNEYKRLADRTRAASKRRQLLEGKGDI